MITDDAVGEGQSHPCPFANGFGGKIGFKNSGNLLFFDTASCILDIDLNVVTGIKEFCLDHGCQLSGFYHRQKDGSF
jgi:hypothetical protein